MRRIPVGCECAGKTTLANEIVQRTGRVFVEKHLSQAARPHLPARRSGPETSP